MTDIRDFANRAPSTPTLGNIADYVSDFDEESPIDEFIGARTNLLILAPSGAVNANMRLGQLVFLGLVSAFENYCRGILSGCLGICPRSQSKASEKNINFGGALWYGKAGAINRSAFEAKSFADCAELKKSFREYACFELADGTFGTVLDDFEKLMQFRHAIVHSDGVLPGRNAVKLEIVRSQKPLRVDLNFDRLQSAASALSALVELINRELFFEFCKRWATDWRARADWQPDKASHLLKEVVELFSSKPYRLSLPNQRKWSASALKSAVENKFDLT